MLSAAGRTSAGPSSPAAGPVLYDQFGNEATANPYDITSQDFETSLDAADSEAADDFVIQDGLEWTIDAIDVDGELFSRDGEPPVPAGFNLRFYADDPADHLPGVPVQGAERLNQAYTSLGTAPGDVQVTLSPPVSLGSGTWWVSVQARLDYGSATDTRQWFWHHRAVQANQGAAWRNPGDLWHMNCLVFSRRGPCQGSTQAPDEVFRLHGDQASVTPPPPPPPPQPPPPPPPSAPGCRVPNVVGKTLGRAATLILRGHCRVGSVTRRHSARRKRGKVLAQSPRAGRSLQVGARVRLVVGRR
jgi:PASTA domain-containing protein